MPAPVGPLMKSLIEAKMPPTHIGSPHFQKFLTAVATEVCTQWTKWMLSMSWGGNTVNGAGIGAWSGTGSNGKLNASPYKIDPDTIFDLAGFSIKTVATKKFLNGLNTVLGQKFDTWVGSFKFAGNPYLGTSGASPLSPGPFVATNTPMPLIGMGQGTNPSNIAKDWEAILSSAPDPVFSLNDPNCHTKLFTGAVGSTIEEQFIIFLAQSMGTGDLVQGTAAPGAGTGSGKSQATGKVV